MALRRRWIIAAAAISVAGPAALAAAADIPLPRPKPGAGIVDPEEAIGSFLDPDAPFESRKTLTDRLGTAVTPYAAAASRETGTPMDRDGVVELEARLSEEGPVLGEGVTWRVFGEIPSREGRLPLLRTVEGGSARIVLQPGRYVVHAAFGRAGISQLVRVDRPLMRVPFVLEAGGLKLDAVNEDGSTLVGERLTFEIFAPGEFESDGRRLVAEAKPGTVLPLPAGPYHVVSRYGGTNAVRSADLLVSPGKLTAVTMQHRAADISLKLVSEEGGEAIADTEWTVSTADGVELFSYIGAFPSLVLAEGRYVAEVRHRDGVFRRDFEVEAGRKVEVEVLATVAD